MERMRELRTEQGLSQAQAAVRAGMDPATWNRLEQGKGNPNLRTLERVADALGVEVVELLGKGRRRSSLEPSFNDMLAEERRLPALAQAIDRAANVWAGRVSNPHVGPEEKAAIERTVEVLADQVTTLLGSGGLSAEEQRELYAASSALGRVDEAYAEHVDLRTRGVYVESDERQRQAKQGPRQS